MVQTTRNFELFDKKTKTKTKTKTKKQTKQNETNQKNLEKKKKKKKRFSFLFLFFFFNHFLQSVDAILEGVSVAETMFNVKLLLSRLSSFSVQKKKKKKTR